MANPSIPPYKGAHRTDLAEIMDNLHLDNDALVAALDTISRVNRQLGGSHVVLSALGQVFRQHPGETISVCDMGCGGGDIARNICRFRKRHALPLSITAADANPAVIQYAKKQSAHCPEIDYCVANIFEPVFRSRHFDVITASLFLHHFPDDRIVEILEMWKKQARKSIIINDLRRNRLAFHLFKLYTFVTGAPFMARYDGAVSILRGFKRHELRELLSRAGISRYTLRRKWAFRWQIIINTQSE